MHGSSGVEQRLERNVREVLLDRVLLASWRVTDEGNRLPPLAALALQPQLDATAGEPAAVGASLHC